MKYRVLLSTRAELDIDGTLAWLSRKGVSSSTAGRWHRRLLAAVATLESDPQHCAIAAEAAELGVELREMHFGRRRDVYRIFFLIEKRNVIVIRVRHAARDFLRPDDLL